MKVVSFFAGCGGLDLGFEQAGFDVIWANEFDKSILPTYRLNHPKTIINTCDIRDLMAVDVPDCDGFIGGPPCQSWSLAGKMNGLADERGQVFLDYIRLIKSKQPKFFVIENVVGIISDKHYVTFRSFMSSLSDAGYSVKYKVLNVANYGIPQDRERIFVVGIRNDIDVKFGFPASTNTKCITLKQAIGDLSNCPRAFSLEDLVSSDSKPISNHDYYDGEYDSRYMARNRVRSWNEVSYTIPATASKIPLHPQAPKMEYIDSTHRRFVKGSEYLYRRLSVRECARIQSFPDEFYFVYSKISDGYKMVGNAVPPKIGKVLGSAITDAFLKINQKNDVVVGKTQVLIGYYKDEKQYQTTLKNKLYYVRTGFRKGAMQMSPGILCPEYLLLHHGKERHLHKLRKKEPVLKTSEELRKMGFLPSGEIYLCFELLNSNDVREKYSINTKNNFTVTPVIVDLEINN